MYLVAVNGPANQISFNPSMGHGNTTNLILRTYIKSQSSLFSCVYTTYCKGTSCTIFVYVMLCSFNYISRCYTTVLSRFLLLSSHVRLLVILAERSYSHEHKGRCGRTLATSCEWSGFLLHTPAVHLLYLIERYIYYI